MNAFTHVGFNAQRSVCALLSTLIVVIGLALASYATHEATQLGYSVTVTQVQ